jgi:two-component system response regulator HydG
MTHSDREPDRALAGATNTLLADLLASLVAIGRSMQEEFDPRRFLDQLSDHLQRRVPHDRLVVDYLDENGRTFSVLDEHATPELLLHEDHYTTAFDPGTRYVVAEWVLRTVFAGKAMRVDDFPTDPRFAELNPHERKLVDAGLRSGLLVPLESGGRAIGALVATTRNDQAYTENHLGAFRQVADLIAPFIENVVLLQRERRRRRRLRALEGLAHALGGGLNVRNVFARLADAIRPVLDFDSVGVALLTASGRDLEMLAEFDDAPGGPETPARIPLDDFSFAARVEAGETALIHDAPAELDPARPGDRLIIDGGGRSCLIVPMKFGERVGGGFYFGKRRPNWYDRLDAEVAAAVSAAVVLTVQHQRLAEEQRRLASVEVHAKKLEQRLATLRDELDERYGFDRIIGRSPALREVLARAAKVAPTEATVLLTGESGTGKEMVARAVHHASGRADGPFVAINCAALPDTLMESELFGHERGAFTGAERQKPGRFELASGGTLFLDEVGELSPGVQAKLLRVLQEREFQRVGGTVTLRADVRLIAATNRELDKEVAGGRFRDDLYYRLNVFAIHLPALRDRGDDVLLLADRFVSDLGARMAKGDVGLSRDAREALLRHHWPGNIRELQNAVERALIVSDGGLLTAAQLGIGQATPRGEAAPRTRPIPVTDAAPARPLAEIERQVVHDALRESKGNKSRAAAQLGLTRSQLYTRLKRHGLED